MRPIDADVLLEAPFRITGKFGGKYPFEAITVKMVESAPTIDPIRAAGGCRCGECKHLVDCAKCYTPFGARLPSQECIIVDSDDFCSYGEPREAQGDG